LEVLGVKELEVLIFSLVGIIVVLGFTFLFESRPIDPKKLIAWLGLVIFLSAIGISMFIGRLRQPPSPQSIASQLFVKVFYVRRRADLLSTKYVVVGMIRNPTKFNLEGITLSFKFYCNDGVVSNETRTVCVFDEYLRPNDVYFFEETFSLYPPGLSCDVKVSVEGIREIW